MASDSTDQGTAPQGDGARMVEAIVERFGGIRPMAAKLSIPVTTVQGWKKRGHIPPSRRADLTAAAQQHGIPLSDAELDLATTGDGVPDTGHPEEHDPPPVIEAEPVHAAAYTTPDPDPAPQPAPWSAPEPEPRPQPRPEPKVEPRVEPAPPPPAPSRQRGGGAVAFLALLAGLGGLGMGALALHRSGGIVPAFTELAGGPAAEDPRAAEIGVLRAQLAELAARPAANPALAAEIDRLSRTVAALESRPASEGTVAAVPADPAQPYPAQPAPDLAPLADRLSALEARLAALPEGADPGAVQRLVEDVTELRSTTLVTAQNVQSLAQRLEQVQGAVASLQAESGGAEGLALVVAAGQLHTTLLTGRPFARELEAVRALAAEDPEFAEALAALEPRAAEGLTPAVALKERFDRLAGEILRADRQRTDASWGEQALGRIASLVTVRRSSGEVAGSGTDAIVARAQNALEHGDLKLAASELEALEGPAAEVAAPWLAEARARVAAETAAAALAQRAVAMLAGGAAEGTP